MSLCPIGMPSSGPFVVPAITRASAARASASARSSVGRMKACSVSSFAFMRAMQSSVSSTGDSFFSAISFAASAMVKIGSITAPPW